MAFATNLTKYTLVETPARVQGFNGPNTGKAGVAALYDVYNSINGDAIVQNTPTPRADAIAALNTASVASSAIVSYQNGSGSVAFETTLALAH